KFDSAKGWQFTGLGFWDAQGDYVNHLIHAAVGGGYESAANTFLGVQRNGDDLDSVHDFYLEHAQDSVIIHCYNEAGINPSYNWNNKRVVVMGVHPGELNVAQRLLLRGDQLVHQGNVLANILYGDAEIHLG